MTPMLETQAEPAAPAFHRVTRGSRVLGFVAIDSTVGGRARGGLRFATDIGEDEIRAAARSMTLKYGLLGLPQGGAKAGIVGDPDAEPAEKRRLLAAFAQAAAPLLRARTYIPDADMGTSADGIRAMMESLGVPVGPREWRANRSGQYTAHSCLASAQAIVARRGGSLAGCRVAIEGFGKVGSVVARLLHGRGARVVAVSTSRGALHREAGLDVERLARVAAERGSRFVEAEPDLIERSALLELPVDLLLPCARFHSIHAGNVGRVAARAVCAGANDPVSPEAERVLFERGVVCPPDFLTNCGGVLGGTLEFAGVAPARIGPLVEGAVQSYAASLLERSARQGVPPRRLAEEEALARHAAATHAAEHPSLGQRLVRLGLEGYRRGLVPEALVSRVAPRYLTRWAGP
jgi:glutamate dehydrogenase/leucine dehydrogenase